MAQILIQKLLNNEIRTVDLLLWIKDTNYEDEKYKQLFNVCSQKDFVTYFLNILHDQLICDGCTETSQTEKSPGTNEFQEKLQKKHFSYNSTDQDKIKLAESSFLNDSSHHSINTSYTSTPKDKSYFNDNSIDNFSPIRKTNSARRESENSKTNPLCLGDFIVNTKKNNLKKKNCKNNCESQKKTSKRINPTNLNDNLDRNSFKKSGNSFNFENNSSHESVLEEEVNRDFLKKEIEKLSVNRNTIGENILVQIKVKSEPQTKKNRKIIPNPKLVRFKKELEKVILIYETLLLNDLVFSYIGELHFVISLLFNEHCDSDESDYSVLDEKTVTFQEIFRNYHNVTFFASCILEKSIFYLKSLDKSTLKYLCGNEHLKLYSPNLISTLDEISEKKEERLSKLYESDSKQNICFVLDTDNRSNFPSDISFQSFKKQRDMFYEILKIWEDGHMVPGWSFEYSLGRRIRMLLGYHKDTVNLMRLSRLFMDQLLSTCGRNAAGEIFTETSGSLLTSLPNIDRDKFDRLKTRLVTKQSSSSDTAPEFTGYQEFYKEFILFSSNPNFLRHLCDTFISEIIELNDTTFNNLDTESNEYETDLNTKKAFVNCLKSLRILSKFLGFTESLPYKNETASISSNLMELQLKMRNRVKPNFDVLTILQRGIINGNLVLCVPWICKYLSMLDTVTLKTNYYINIIEMLISIYRNIGKTEFSLPEYNIYLIKYSLGWLFERNHFPISIFFERMNFKHEFFPVNGRSANLDNLVIVDQNILYIFCFCLDKIKMLLTSKTTVRDRMTVRHITPLTAVESPKEIFRKKIEMQLEEAFFNGHPSSIKKTVDFVAERIASTCVKYLCYHIVPEFKKRFTKELQIKLKSWLNEGKGNTKTDVRLQCEQLAKENFRTLVKLCSDEVDKIIERNLKNAIHSMVPMDFLPQMEDICIFASKRICMEKVKQWTSSHIIQNILTKDIGSEIVKLSNEDPKVKSKPMFVLPAGGSNNLHSENTETAAHILDKIRDLSLAMLSTSVELKESTLIEFLNDTYTTLTNRNDVNEAIHLMICQQMLDFLFLLVAFRPSVIKKIQNHFFNIWKLRLYNCKELFSNVLCQRNIMLLAQGGNNSESWSTIATLCVSLFKEGLMNCDNFESQCAGFFKADLDENTLANVSMFLKIFVEKYKKDCNSSKFTYLLEFLSDYCSDL